VDSSKSASIVRAAKLGEDSSVTNAGGGSDKHSSTKKIKELSRTIDEHSKKMVSAAKMKCFQWERDRSYAMQAEICAFIRSLGTEKRQMTIQMKA
jgi:hypothetical protein